MIISWILKAFGLFYFHMMFNWRYWVFLLYPFQCRALIKALITLSPSICKAYTFGKKIHFELFFFAIYTQKWQVRWHIFLFRTLCKATHCWKSLASFRIALIFLKLTDTLQCFLHIFWKQCNSLLGGGNSVGFEIFASVA